ncbi:MAG TPA: phytanoyl-CoA dioxygenase family protein [Pyrinomonadaceae bacterium]|jgi:ectoine hydroxylase-related dioxygenase (phytanoyl-CoA dioxygenase family)
MVKDLSRYHQPLSNLFPPLNDWQLYRLSDEQIEFYREHGYVAGIKMLNEDQLNALREELAELIDPAHPGHELFYEFHANESGDPEQILFHSLGAWRIKSGLHDLLWHPAFVVPAAQLLGGPVRFWHDQIFYKPAHHGGVVIWHQDYSYWTRTTPMAHISCWIGLDDSTRENGCVHYVPGSHRWQLLPRASFANSMDAVLDSLTATQRAQFKPEAIELKAGEGSFHHPLMVHGSYANNTDRPRRAVVLNALRDGVTSASADPLLAGVPAIPVGEKMGGQFFPLLFDPAKSSS